MSVKATNWAWETGRDLDMGGGLLLTLLRIADHADHDGVCWPGEKQLAEYTVQGETTVRGHLKKLEAMNLIHRERRCAEKGRGRARDHIHLHLDQPADPAGEKPKDQPAGDNGLTGRSEHDQPAGDDTPYMEEPSVEPSGTKKEKAPPSGDAAFLQEIFDLWVKLTERDSSTVFNEKRKRVIRMRLKDGHSRDEIRRAVIGCVSSNWHMKRGKHANRGGPKRDQLTLILRDTEHVEEFAKLAGERSPDAFVSHSECPISESRAATEAWEKAKERLRSSVPESTFEIYLVPLEAAGERDGKLVLLDTSDKGVGNWVRRRYLALIKQAVELFVDYSDIEIVSQTDLDLQEK